MKLEELRHRGGAASLGYVDIAESGLDQDGRKLVREYGNHLKFFEGRPLHPAEESFWNRTAALLTALPEGEREGILSGYGEPEADAFRKLIAERQAQARSALLQGTNGSAGKVQSWAALAAMVGTIDDPAACQSRVPSAPVKARRGRFRWKR